MHSYNWNTLNHASLISRNIKSRQTHLHKWFITILCKIKNPKIGQFWCHGNWCLDILLRNKCSFFKRVDRQPVWGLSEAPLNVPGKMLTGYLSDALMWFSFISREQLVGVDLTGKYHVWTSLLSVLPLLSLLQIAIECKTKPLWFLNCIWIFDLPGHVVSRQQTQSLQHTVTRSEPDPCLLCHVPHVSLPTHWLFQVPGLTHLWLIGPRLFPVPGPTLLLLIRPRFFPVPGHTPVSNWTSSVPVLNRALKSIQC